jgi:hypothetical protein
MPGKGYKGDGYGKASMAIVRKGVNTLGDAAKAVREGGPALARQTGDPDDAKLVTDSPARRKLKKLLGY